MKITILKQHKRFHVKCCFNQNVHNVIKKYKNRYFNMSTRIWYLPADDFTSFINDLENDANAKQFDIKIIDQATIVYIQTKEDKIHVGFSTFIDVENPTTQIIMDKDNMEKVINLCKDSGYQVEIKE